MPGGALDHDLARVVFAFADQRDVAARGAGVRPGAVHLRAHPLRAEPRLARAAAAEREPRRPRPAIVGGER
jgi:hypothetical protein